VVLICWSTAEISWLENIIKNGCHSRLISTSGSGFETWRLSGTLRCVNVPSLSKLAQYAGELPWFDNFFKVTFVRHIKCFEVSSDFLVSSANHDFYRFDKSGTDIFIRAEICNENEIQHSGSNGSFLFPVPLWNLSVPSDVSLYNISETGQSAAELWETTNFHLQGANWGQRFSELTAQNCA